jgi:hypothetical protein
LFYALLSQLLFRVVCKVQNKVCHNNQSSFYYQTKMILIIEAFI